MNINADKSNTQSSHPDVEIDGTTQSDPIEQDLPSGTSQIVTLEAELAAMQDRWMRSEAEIANVRSSAKRDIEDARQYAVQKFATDVVEAAENLRRGLESIPPASDADPQIVAKLREGFIGVENSFINLLKRNGIAKQDPTGTPFDPKLHQAMSEIVSSSQTPGTVVQALSSAWTLNGRLLRPAMVVVAKAADPSLSTASARRLKEG